jgi:hypothetical protein
MPPHPIRCRWTPLPFLRPCCPSRLPLSSALRQGKGKVPFASLLLSTAIALLYAPPRHAALANDRASSATSYRTRGVPLSSSRCHVKEGPGETLSPSFPFGYPPPAASSKDTMMTFFGSILEDMSEEDRSS